MKENILGNPLNLIIERNETPVERFSRDRTNFCPPSWFAFKAEFSNKEMKLILLKKKILTSTEVMLLTRVRSSWVKN